jgi:hypothetical protein
MSTRACIAHKDSGPDKWVGVYSHWDGYPSWLGKEIWKVLQTQFIGNKGKIGVGNKGDVSNAIRSFIQVYIKGHMGGWSSFDTECYCHSPEYVMRDGVRSGKITSGDPDPLFLEWVYILDPEKKTMTILASKAKPKYKENPKIKSTAPVKKDGYWDYGHCAFKHEIVEIVDLTAGEPDWKKIEAKAG